MAARATRSARRAAASPCHLLTIFPELQLHVAGFLSDPSDCAALCLAVPRGLGLRALRELPQFKEILVSVAMRLLTGELQIDEALLRRYLWDKRMTDDGCVWLTAAARKEGLRQGILKRLPDANSATTQWHLSWWVGGWGAGALVRLKYAASGDIVLYEGKDGAEQMVRVELSGGSVHHYEGERGAERMVRGEVSGGSVYHYEGERGAERMVRGEDSGGSFHHYEGERGAERIVRMEWSDGRAHHFEGERGVERMVRAEFPDGSVWHHEGEKRAERTVRVDLPDGSVIHYEGERGAERIVREEWPDGSVFHFVNTDGNVAHDAK